MRLLARALTALLGLTLVVGCAREAEPPSRPALWRATSGSAVVWLFGTIHLLPAGEDWQGGAVGRAIAESDTLITEIPDADPQAQAAAFLRRARVEGLPPLVQRVGPAAQPALRTAIAAAGVPEQSLNRMATWAAALALTSGAARDAGGTREAAPEAVLAQAFRGKRHVAFETFDGQLAIFAALPEAAQRKLLVASLDSARDPAAAYRKLLASWRAGDLAALSVEADAALTGAPELAAALVDQRNKAWADALRQRAARPGTTLVAVGAGHMVGPAALPRLLAERGFAVSRVQ